MSSVSPLSIETKKPRSSQVNVSALAEFTSYNFDRNILTPASAFRFTAPGVDKDKRLSIRSGDMCVIFAENTLGVKYPIATGFIDETDTHITPTNIEYVLTGRDTLGQLVDNASVDVQNRIVNFSQYTLVNIARDLISNTRMPKTIITQQTPNNSMIYNTNPGETKINSLQRYLDYTNCLVWTKPNGQMVLGKPNFYQAPSGILQMKSDRASTGNNMLECRVRRSPNQAIRQISVQLQTLGQVDAAYSVKYNNAKDIKDLRTAGVGRSVMQLFSYGSGEDAVNQVTQVGNQSGNDRNIGAQYALREMARENMKLLDVEVVVRGHMNVYDAPYDVDQVYTVIVDDENLYEDMYVYGVSYELTLETGTLTRLRLCQRGSIVAGAAALPGSGV